MFSKIGIVGAGLIGGSFALAMRKAGFGGSVLGVSSPATIEVAKRCGVIDEGVTLECAVAECGLLYLAQPIGRIIETIGRLGALPLKPGLLVTDAGSTKRQIVSAGERALPAGVFVGGHPMAGKESRGPENADADLFVGRTYFLTPRRKTAGYEELTGWVTKIGAAPVEIEPDTHDRVVSFTSHLAQFAATGLAVTVEAQLGVRQAQIGAGRGLHDMTRLALSEWEIWADIVSTNTEQIDAALAAYIGELEKLRGELSNNTFSSTFELGKKFARSLRNTPKCE